jgi:hypothetical protein
MDVALHHVISHQPVDDIGTFALCGAEDQRIPEKIALIDKGIGADALALAKILEGIVGIERVCSNLKFLTVARGMQFILGAAVDIGQLSS